MNQETANYIMQRMSTYLDNSQMIKLKDTLDESLRQSEDGILEKSSQELLDMFLATKRLEGRSEKTLFLYRFNIEKMLEKSDKNVCVIGQLYKSFILHIPESFLFLVCKTFQALCEVRYDRFIICPLLLRDLVFLIKS